MTYADGAAKIARVNRWVLTITCDYCTLSNGVAPCTASTQCYYTYQTCKAVANYSKGTKNYVYQHGGPPLTGALPYLSTNFNLIPTKIVQEDFRTERGELKIELFDDLAHPLANPDKIGFTAEDQGRYWPNWIMRNLNYRGRPASLRRDLLDESGALYGSKYFFYGILDDIDYNGKGVVITIKDRLWSAAVAKMPIKVPTTVKLNGLHTSVVTTITLDDDTGAYTASTHFKAATAAEPRVVKIESEYIIYTGVSGATLTGCTRGAYGTTAAQHADNTAIQQVEVYATNAASTSWANHTGVSVDHILMDLLCNYGGIDPTWIDTVDSGIVLNEGGVLTDADTTITLDDAGDLDNLGVIKIENEFIRYTGKSGNNLTGCKRGMYGTTAASHADTTAIYTTSWGYEFRTWKPNLLFKCRLEAERAVKDNINSVRASIILDMWMNEDGLITGKMQTPPIPSYTPATINEENIIHGSKKFFRNEDARVTRTTTFFNATVVDPATSGEDADADYSQAYAYIDSDGEAPNNYNEIRKDVIYSPWIYLENDAAFISARRFIKFRDGAPQIEFAVELKDEPDVGDYILGTFEEIPNEDGSDHEDHYYVISKSPGPDNRITLMVEDAGFAHHKFGLIGFPNPVLDEDLTNSETDIDIDLTGTGWTFAAFPTVGTMRCLPDGEVIKWAAVSDQGSNIVRFTGCSRGQDGSSAVVHTTGDEVMILFSGTNHYIHTQYAHIGSGDPPYVDSNSDYTEDEIGYYIY